MPKQIQTTEPLPQLLLVEDSHTTHALLTKYLGRNYQLIQANDGVEAWKLLNSDREFDLVITDVHMPNMSGHQLLVKIRKSDDIRHKNLPVIVMTSAEDNVDRNLAFLNGANDFLIKPLDEMELQARIKVHYRLSRTIRELEASKRALAAQVTTDSLTKLKNRRAFFENGGTALELAQLKKSELSVILLDIDYFKKINDTFGHQAGDEALMLVGTILTQMTRPEDTVSRIGGEEFAILLPGVNRLSAAVMAERIRATIEGEKFVSENKIVPITVSIGIASYAVDYSDSIDHLLGAADRRLYLAKKGGRNRICVNDEGRSSFA